MTNVKTIKLTDDADTSNWFLDNEGDLFETRSDAEIRGLCTVIVAEAWYPGNVNEWEKSILSRIEAANKSNTIKHLVEKFSAKWGGFENIALFEPSYHACNPSRENGWDCNAVRISGNQIAFGKVRWDFEKDLEDAGDYDWDFGQCDFTAEETFDLTDDADADAALSELNRWK